MIKILLASRHELTDEQYQSLVDFYGSDIEISHENLFWEATDNAQSDLYINKAKWEYIRDRYNVVAGVFPPVAIEALPSWKTKYGIDVISPVSCQEKSDRESGSAYIPFKHVRWAFLRIGFKG